MDTEDTDRNRTLGVVEAIVAARDQCPSGRVRVVAESALEAIRTRRPGVLREQAYLVSTAISGWRGERAVQVQESLRTFLKGKRPADEP